MVKKTKDKAEEELSKLPQLSDLRLSELNLKLFSAVMLGTKAEVVELIHSGADVNALNLNKLCPLDLAKAYRRTEVTKILKEHGAIPAPKLRRQHTKK